MCLISSDLNEKYIGLYPYVRKAWLKMGIPTLLILIANEIPNELLIYSDEILLFKPIKNIHTAYIAQTIRILYPALIPNKNIIISDMDIIPLCKNYFINSVKNIDDDKFVVYRNAYIKQEMYGICYNLANSNIWSSIFNINNINDVNQKLIKWYNPQYSGIKNCEGWFTDQKKLFEYLNKYDKNKIIILEDNDLKFNRLDKRNKKYILDNIDHIYKNIYLYTDFHVIRPYYKYIHIINKIIDLI